MSEEKPLHVRVAEALGKVACDQWEPFHSGAGSMINKGRCQHDCYPVQFGAPHYDTDWSATGPLIKKYGITVLADYGHYDGWWSGKPVWRAMAGAYDDLEFGDHGSAIGATPLEAVCRLILALHEAGKLKAA